MRTKTKRVGETAQSKLLPHRKKSVGDRKLVTLNLQISQGDLDVFSSCASHFGFCVEVVMEHGLMGQLSAMGDDTISTLAWFEDLPIVEDLVPVTLSFIPEAHALLVLVSSLLRRPLEDLARCLLHQEALCYDGDMEDAEKDGGFDNHHELVAQAKRVIAFEFESRRGRMTKEQDRDAWEWLNLERYRPAHLSPSDSTFLSRKGGVA